MKKLVRIIATIMTLVLIVISGTKVVFAEEFKQSSLEGVVFVISVIQDENNETYYCTGTGFFVGKEGEKPQYIITNCHVISDFLLSGGSAGNSILQIAFDKDTYEEAYVVTYDAEKDIAILKLAEPTDKRSPLLLRTVDDSDLGDSVFAIGYPATADETITAVNYFGKNDASVTGGRISRFITESGSGRRLLQMDVAINHGSSGGPLIDQNGYAIGINTLGSLLDTNLNYAVSIEEAIPLLNNNNIPYELAKDTGFDMYLIIIIVGAGILLVALIVILVVHNKNKKNATMNKKVSDVPVSPQLTSSVTPTLQEKKLSPIIRSMAVQHSGLSCVVTPQPLIIGRDAKVCRLIFREDTPGVSSKHCQIYFDEKSHFFILTDLKSTYGTFLNNGQQLTPNVPYPLKSKDSFYLGERENLIYVEVE